MTVPEPPNPESPRILTSESLGHWIQENKNEIIESWIDLCQKEISAAQDQSRLFLRDHIPVVIDQLVIALLDQFTPSDAFEDLNLVALHGKQRADNVDYTAKDLATEYRLLRQVILESASAGGKTLALKTLNTLCSFMEASLTASLEAFLRYSVKEKLEQERKNQRILAEASNAHAGRVTAETARKQLYDFFMQSPVPMVILLGSDHYFSLANPPYERLVGRKPTGKTLYEVFTPDEIRHFKPLLDGVYKTGVPYVGYEMPLRLPNEAGHIEEQFVDFGYYPFREEDGSIKGILSFAVDVTMQVRARKSIEVAKLSVEQERENFRNLFRQTPEMVCILSGPEHRFEFVNEAHIKALGFDATGMAVREAQPESVEVHGILDEVFRTGKTAELVEIPVTVTHRLRYFNLTYAARRDHDGTINGVMILGTEVTEQVQNRRAIEESAASFRDLANSMPQIVWRSAADGRLNYLNERFFKFTGLSSEKDINELWPQSIHPEDLPITQEMWSKAVEGGQSYRVEHRMRHKDGFYRWHLSRAIPVYNDAGAVLRWYGTSTDIHDFKLLAHDLKEAQESAEAASAAKSAFLANMSHEIRTPLGAIMGFVELLNQPDLEPSEATNFISIIHRNSEQLLRIIDDILDLSKVEAGKMLIENIEFSLVGLISDFSSLFGLKAREQSIHFETRALTELPETVTSDPVRIRQILANIVGNAIKFTKIGKVELSISFENSFLIFRVTDTGRGISPEQKEKLFQPFAQADVSTTRKYGGTGLGLVLTKKLSEALGGGFYLETSELGKGSTFVAKVKVQLPSRSRLLDTSQVSFSNRHVLRDAMKQGELASLKLLLVEDAPDNQKLIHAYLHKAGADVVIASNGREGLEKALAGDYDLVLMDVQMPYMDGHEATRTLRSRGYTKPIVALTAHAMKEEVERTVASGFSGFLSKPLQREELFKTIQQLTN